MLVITRKPGESIEVDGPALIKFIDYNQGRARIGLDAPDSTRIMRTELLEREAKDANLPDVPGR